jgi:hypothetical protein
MKKTSFFIFFVPLLLVISSALTSGCRKEVHDNSVLPTVITLPVNDIGGSSATGGGDVVDNGGSNVFARGVCWGLNEHPVISDFHSSDGSGNGSFSSSINDLWQNTTFYVRAYAKNNAGIAYGESLQFTTISAFIAGEYSTRRGEDVYYLTIRNSGNDIRLIAKSDTGIICTCDYACQGKLLSDPKNGLVVDGYWYMFKKTAGPYIPLYFVVQQKDSISLLTRESDVSYELAYKLGSTYTYLFDRN